MKIEMVGSFTAPNGNAMPEDCTRCHNAEWGTIVVDGICVKCLVEDNAKLRKAGEKMAKQLRELRGSQYDIEIDDTALAEWEAANK